MPVGNRAARNMKSCRNHVRKMGYVITKIKRTNKKPGYNNMNAYRFTYHKKK